MAFGSAVATLTGPGITLPSGLTAGDAWMVACSADFTGISFGASPGGGLALLDGPTNISADGQSIALYGGIYTSGTVTFIPTGGGDLVFYALRWTGRADSSPFTVQATTPFTGSATNVDLTGVTAVAGDDICAFAMLDTGGGTVTQTPPGGYTERLDTGQGFTMAAMATADDQLGATGTLTFTASAGTAYAGWVVRIAAGGAGPIVTPTLGQVLAFSHNF